MYTRLRISLEIFISINAGDHNGDRPQRDSGWCFGNPPNRRIEFIMGYVKKKHLMKRQLKIEKFIKKICVFEASLH